MGMTIRRSKLIACDRVNCRLQFIDISAADPKDWRFDAPFGSRGEGKGQFSGPIDVAVAGDVLFVIENGNDRIQSFTMVVNAASRALTVTFRAFIGSKGSAIGQFQRPRGLAVCGS